MRLLTGQRTHLSQVVMGLSLATTNSSLLLTCYLLFHSTPGCADLFSLLSLQCVCVSESYLSPKPQTRQSLPSMLISIDFLPSKCQHNWQKSCAPPRSLSPVTWVVSAPEPIVQASLQPYVCMLQVNLVASSLAFLFLSSTSLFLPLILVNACPCIYLH